MFDTKDISLLHCIENLCQKKRERKESQGQSRRIKTVLSVTHVMDVHHYVTKYVQVDDGQPMDPDFDDLIV